jgi:hypothetical protein
LARGSSLASKRAPTGAKIQKSAGPSLVNDWIHKHDPKLEHEASELFYGRSRKGKKWPKNWSRWTEIVLEKVWYLRIKCDLLSVVT